MECHDVSFVGALFSAPKQPSTPLQLGLGTDTSRKLLIGRTGLAGDMVFQGVSDSDGRQREGDNRLAHIVYALAGHRIQRLNRVYADGELIRSTPMVHGFRTEIPAFRDGRSARMWLTYYDGRDDQVADPYMVSRYILPYRWRSSDRLRGVAHVVLTAWSDKDVLTSIPEFIFDVNGAYLYDRRKDTTAGGTGSQRWDNPTSWAYTDNPAVALDHYQLGIVGGSPRRIVFGMGLNANRLPYGEFRANADICDETVFGKSRYAANGRLNAGMDHRDVISALSRAMAATPYDNGGQIIVRPQQTRAVRLTLTDADLDDSGRYNLTPSPGGEDIINTVRGTYVNPNAKFNSEDYPPVQDDDLIAVDGREFEDTFDLPLEIDSDRAQRLANIRLEIEKRRATISETYMPIANILEEGDWYERVSNLRGPSTKVYQAVKITRNLDRTVTIQGVETDPSITAWGENQARPVPTPDAPEPISNVYPPAPVGSTATGDREGGGATLPSVVVTVTPATGETMTGVQFVEVEYGISNGLTGESLGITTGTARLVRFSYEASNKVELTDTLPSSTYAYRVRSISDDVIGDWSEFQTFTTGSVYTVPNSNAVGGVSLADISADIVREGADAVAEAQLRINAARTEIEDAAEIARGAITEAFQLADSVEADARDALDLRLGNRINAYDAVFGENAANAETYINARADDRISQSSVLNALKAEFGSNTAETVAYTKTLTDADKAISDRVDIFETVFGDTSAEITTYLGTFASATEAVAQRVNAYDAVFGANAANAISVINARADAQISQSSALNALKAEFGSNTAETIAYTKTLTDADKAISDRVDIFEAVFGDTQASVTNYVNTRADAQIASSSVIQQIQARGQFSPNRMDNTNPDVLGEYAATVAGRATEPTLHQSSSTYNQGPVIRFGRIHNTGGNAFMVIGGADVTPGEHIYVTGYVGQAGLSNLDLRVFFRKADGSGDAGSSVLTNTTGVTKAGGVALSDYEFHASNLLVPAAAGRVDLLLRMGPSTSATNYADVHRFGVYSATADQTEPPPYAVGTGNATAAKLEAEAEIIRTEVATNGLGLAEARSDLQLQARTSPATVNPNSNFADWPNDVNGNPIALPPEWTQIGGTLTRVTGEGGKGFSAKLTASSVGAQIHQQFPITQGTYIMTVRVRRGSHNYNSAGAGFVIRDTNGGGNLGSKFCNFQTKADDDGDISTTKEGWRQFSLRVVAPAGTGFLSTFNATSNTAYGSLTGDHDIEWGVVAITPATALEADAGRAFANGGSLTEVREVTSSLEGNAEAFRLVELGAGGAVTRLVQRVVSTGVNAFSEFLISADKILLKAGQTLFAVLPDRVTVNAPIDSVNGNVVTSLGSPNASIWSGPTSVALASRTDANNVLGIASDGTARIDGQRYIPGTPGAADALIYTDTAAKTLTGAGFIANGNPVRGSLEFERVTEREYTQSSDPGFTAKTDVKGEVTLTLQRRIGTGGWVTIGTRILKGRMVSIALGQFNGGVGSGTPDFWEITEQFEMRGKLFVSQTDTDGQNVTWRGLVSAITDLPNSHTVQSQFADLDINGS